MASPYLPAYQFPLADDTSVSRTYNRCPPTRPLQFWEEQPQSVSTKKVPRLSLRLIMLSKLDGFCNSAFHRSNYLLKHQHTDIKMWTHKKSTRVFTCVCTYSNSYAHASAYMHTDMHMHVHVFICTCTYAQQYKIVSLLRVKDSKPQFWLSLV